MPAVSVRQRRFLAIQEHLPASERSVHMSKKKFQEFTKTKETNLPYSAKSRGGPKKRKKR
jgi:hypothetical protein